MLKLLRNLLYAKYPRHGLLRVYREYLNKRAMRLVQNEWFWPLLEAYRHRSKSTGCDFWDYYVL